MTAPQWGLVSSPPPAARWEERRTFASQLGPDADLPFWTTAPGTSGIVPLRPLTLGDILGGAFRGIRFNPPSTMGLTLVITVGIQLVAALLAAAGLVWSGAGPSLLDPAQLGNLFETASGALTVAVAFGLFAGGNVLGTFVLTSMVSYVVCEGVAAHRVTPRETLRRLGRRLGATLAYGGLVSLAVVVGIGLAGGLVVAIGADSGAGVAVGMLAGLVALIVAFPLSVKLMFALPVIAVEGLGPIAAIGRSWRLTHNRFWRTFGISLLASFIVQMAASVMSQLLSVVSLLVSMDNPAAASVGLLATSLLATTLTVPLQAGVTALLYVDARIRDEGLDIALAEAMAR